MTEKKGKRFISVIAVIMMVAALTACGSGSAGDPAGLESASVTEDSSAAVIYFSGTGNTRAVAENISRQLGADIYEIVPQDPYSSEDLDYSNDNCRANKEQQDASARPAIGNDLSKAVESDTIYVGYPIWWGTAPRIIDTFLDKYNLSGKKVYVFCTSASSGIEASISDMQKADPELKIAGGKRFEAGASDTEISGWLNSL